MEHEWLSWKRKPYGRPFKFLEVTRGSGEAASGEVPDESDEQRVPVQLKSPDLWQSAPWDNSPNIREL